MKKRLVFGALGAVGLAVACSGSQGTGLFGGNCDAGQCSSSGGSSSSSGGGDASGSSSGSSGTSSGSSSTSSSGSSGGTTPCARDVECPGRICNWKLNLCTALEPINGPCERDVECQSGTCNWKLSTCQTPGAL